ncbi:UNVERIFIED_CONTAM: hypothetical protein PYX00_008152 [Menopon gallinae]|uniref:Uncharacterized protein n=1 Tax=Menopon gallinae TaxID=328185 RepID=A0AAW2HLX6_9NEOP
MSAVPLTLMVYDEGQVSVATRKMVLLQLSDAADGPMGERDPAVQQIIGNPADQSGPMKSEVSVAKIWTKEALSDAAVGNQMSSQSQNPEAVHGPVAGIFRSLKLWTREAGRKKSSDFLQK